MRRKSNEYKIWKKYQDEKNLKRRTKRKLNKKNLKLKKAEKIKNKYLILFLMFLKYLAL